MDETHYQILGIPSDADAREIKRAYHRLARGLHPDKAETPDQAREFEEKFARASTAYNVLKDAKRRESYDRTIQNQPDESAPGTRAKAPASAIRNSVHAGGKAGAAGKKEAAHGVTPEREAIAQKAYIKGVNLLKSKDFAKAVEFFEAAIANNDAEPQYHARLATALIGAKRSASRAIQTAERAIELDKYNLDYKFNLASIYQTIGSKSNAVKIYEEILRWDESNAMAQQMLREITRRKSPLLDKLAKQIRIVGTLRSKFSK